MRADSKQLLEKHHSIFIIKVIIHDVKMEKKSAENVDGFMRIVLRTPDKSV